MKIAVVGATGLVGTEILKVLEESALPLSEVLPVASERSVGKKVLFKGKELAVLTPEAAIQQQPEFAIFSAGGSTSLTLAPRFAEAGIRVVDNSSAWRMDPEVPLVVPEVNPEVLGTEDMIIANPNCSTIQLVVALWPLHMAFGLERVVVSTYQSVSGSGQKGVDQLLAERDGRTDVKNYPHPIDLNLIPHIDVFDEEGYTREERKVMMESRKIMGLPDLAITCTAVRVPVMGGHSESVNIQFERPITAEGVKAVLKNSPGIKVVDEPETGQYPMPLYVRGQNDVFVGRIREDQSVENGLNLWIVADNLRKGAATNAVQIVEYMARNL